MRTICQHFFAFIGSYPLDNEPLTSIPFLQSGQICRLNETFLAHALMVQRSWTEYPEKLYELRFAKTENEYFFLRRSIMGFCYSGVADPYRYCSTAYLSGQKFNWTDTSDRVERFFKTLQAHPVSSLFAVLQSALSEYPHISCLLLENNEKYLVSQAGVYLVHDETYTHLPQ